MIPNVPKPLQNRPETVELLAQTDNYALWTGAISKTKLDDAPRDGYIIINRQTGIVEAEGASLASSLVGLEYLQDELNRVSVDPMAELRRKQKDRNSMPDFSRMFDVPDDDPTIQ